MTKTQRETVSSNDGMTITRFFKAGAWSYELHRDSDGAELAAAHCVSVAAGRFSRTYIAADGTRKVFNPGRAPILTLLGRGSAPFGPVSEAEAVAFLEDFTWHTMYMAEKGCP
jgi:hypothetical protein